MQITLHLLIYETVLIHKYVSTTADLHKNESSNFVYDQIPAEQLTIPLASTALCLPNASMLARKNKMNMDNFCMLTCLH